MSTSPQPAILGPVPSFGHALVFDILPQADPLPALRHASTAVGSTSAVIGIGAPLALARGAKIEGLRAFPAIVGPGVSLPSTQMALWAYLGGEDPGEILDRARALTAVVGGAFALREEVSTFKYRGGRDLSGYEDGTENPTGEKAVEAAIVSGTGPGLDGSSFVAAQRYVHDLGTLSRLPDRKRDELIGRQQTTNEEMGDAPGYAHVKRTAQESFDPPAFVVRRSMPWGDVREHGLYFVAYGRSLDFFERIVRRMAGLEDGVVDGLFRFTRATSGGYYWCPPLRDGRVDWSALGR